ncbi:MAG TPA: MBL fold metallo-hydrolase [Chitinophagaceae bacterium]|nr:MBL fold metallo-hydrolase [Chitinophagaceae bacterium]
MALYITSLNSGSNGNCYYVGNEDDAVLIDAGISCREVTKRMLRLNLNMRKIKAVFISHEHSDHISGLETLAKKYQLPVYITKGTLQNSSLAIELHLVKSFTPFQPVYIGAIAVTAFPKSHDADDPHSFFISYKNVNIGVFTDIGYACENVTRYFKQCHAAFLESNYDVDMLMNGGYPRHLKARITGGDGHLSNVQALQLFLQHRPPGMTHLILSHLSQNNNRPEIVEQLFSRHAGGVNITVASRYAETPLYHIAGEIPMVQPVVNTVRPKTYTVLRLFED